MTSAFPGIEAREFRVYVNSIPLRRRQRIQQPVIRKGVGDEPPVGWPACVGSRGQHKSRIQGWYQLVVIFPLVRECLFFGERLANWRQPRDDSVRRLVVPI